MFQTSYGACHLARSHQVIAGSALLAGLLIAVVSCTPPPPLEDRIGVAVRLPGEREFTRSETNGFAKLSGLYGRYYGRKAWSTRNDVYEGAVRVQCCLVVHEEDERSASSTVLSSDMTNSDFLRRTTRVLERALLRSDVDLGCKTYDLVFSRNAFYVLDSAQMQEYRIFPQLEKRGATWLPR